MEDISKYKTRRLTNGWLYSVTRKELKNLKASQFTAGDIIKVSKYFIHIKYGVYNTPSLCSWVEDNNFNKLDCTPGNRRGFTPYYVDDFISR